jgi:homocysteine S-methyltransferase
VNALAELIAQQGFVVLDGALATELERHGADLDDPLWSANCLIEAPKRIARVHRDYLEAGADVISSATYQTSEAGFMRHGLSRADARELMREGVQLAVRERDAFWAEESHRAGRLKPLVAASLGPYGACLHDGSEYHGNYAVGWDEVAAFHRERLEVLAATEVDLLAFETIPSLPEAEGIARLLKAFPRKPAWISFSCRDEARVCHGEPFRECVAALAGLPGIAAIGINCTAPQHVPGLLRSAGEVRLPLLVYPNSGETWVAAERRWTGQRSAGFDVTAWYRAGARAVGGCCRTGPEDIARVRAVLRGLQADGTD